VIKLTKAQRELLANMHAHGTAYCIQAQPIGSLVASGLAIAATKGFPRGYRITNEGRAALSTQQKEGE